MFRKISNSAVYRANFPNLKGPRAPSQNCKKNPCCYGDNDRASFSALNQILCGHSRLNGHQTKINQNLSELCAECKVAETVEHFTFDCERYAGRRKELEKLVENILARESMNCSAIDMKILSGNIEGLNKEARSELVGALLNFIKCTSPSLL